MKIRTLQLIGGAGRGACCLLDTSPPAPVSVSYFLSCHIRYFLYVNLHTSKYLSFFSLGFSSAQISLMDNCFFVFLLLCFPLLSLSLSSCCFFLRETSFEKNILKNHQFYSSLRIEYLSHQLRIICHSFFSFTQNGHL